MLWVPGLEAIPMSIAGYDPSDEVLEFLVKPVGSTTSKLAEARAPEYMGVYGPLGKPWYPSGRRILFLAGGSGVAPILHFARKRCNGRLCHVVFGAWRFDEVGEIPSLLSSLGVSVTTACLDEGCDIKGTLVDAYKTLSVEEYDEIVVSGPIEVLRKIAVERKQGIRHYYILEAIVKCGIGLCSSCRLPGTSLLLCVDGPLFPHHLVEEVLLEA